MIRNTFHVIRTFWALFETARVTRKEGFHSLGAKVGLSWIRLRGGSYDWATSYQQGLNYCSSFAAIRSTQTVSRNSYFAACYHFSVEQVPLFPLLALKSSTSLFRPNCTKNWPLYLAQGFPSFCAPRFAHASLSQRDLCPYWKLALKAAQHSHSW